MVGIVLDVAFGASQDGYHFGFGQDKGHGLNIQNSKWVPLIVHNNSYPQDKDHFSYLRGHQLIVKHSKLSATYMVKMGDEFHFQIVVKKRDHFGNEPEGLILIFKRLF